MIKLEHIVLPSPEQWEAVIRGMRNPMNSWERTDSYAIEEGFVVGDDDFTLMEKLAEAGTDHRKFLRMLVVYIDITAPIYWWKEFDTYKVGTVANSCSTMHKIHSKAFTLDDFSHEHLLNDPFPITDEYVETYRGILEYIITALNCARARYLETKDKSYWWQMIQLLPSSYNQKRTVMLNYEVLRNMYRARKHHKLDEWVSFCRQILALPYSDLITG